MQVERIMMNFNPVFGLRNRPRGLKRFSCFSRKRTDLSKKKLHGVCTLTKVYQYAKEERFLFFEPCRTLVDICMELLLTPYFQIQRTLGNRPWKRPSSTTSINDMTKRVDWNTSTFKLLYLSFIPLNEIDLPFSPRYLSCVTTLEKVDHHN